jgi:hypothetical protein
VAVAQLKKTDLKELLREYAWRGEEAFFKLFEHAYKYLFLKNLVNKIEKWRFRIADYRLPDVETRIVFRHPRSNVTVEIDSRRSSITFSKDSHVITLKYDGGAEFKEVLALLELDSKHKFLDDIEKAALELESKLKELAEIDRGKKRFTFTSSNGVVVEVETGNINALREHIRKLTAPLILLSMYARSALSEPSEAYEKVKSRLLDKISSKISWFFSAVDWDRTGEEVAKAAEELAEYVPESPSSPDDVFLAMLVSGVARRLLHGFLNLQDMEEILNSYHPVRVVGSPDPLAIFSDFTETVEFKGVVESPVADRPAVHPTAIISSILVGGPAKFTGTREMEYKVSLVKAGNELVLGLWSTQEGGVAAPSILIVTKSGFYFDVAGLAALGLLEERYGFVSKLAEKLVKASEELLEKASKYARLLEVFYTAYFKEDREPPPMI